MDQPPFDRLHTSFKSDIFTDERYQAKAQIGLSFAIRGSIVAEAAANPSAQWMSAIQDATEFVSHWFDLSMKLALGLAIGTMAAIFCVVLSITIVECLLVLKASQLYNPVSLIAVIAAALVMTSIAAASGWIAATSFALTYLAISLGLLLLDASLYSLETLFIPILGSVVLLSELVLVILPGKALFNCFSWGL